jgi:hypothetical protein
MRNRRSRAYRGRMQFSDSTFAALRIDTDFVERSSARLFWLAVALTLAAVSAGLLAGG